MGLLLGCEQTPREFKKKPRAAPYTVLEQVKYLKDGIRWQQTCYTSDKRGPVVPGQWGKQQSGLMLGALPGKITAGWFRQ